MKRKQKHDGTHLTLEERKIIQAGIENGSAKADIARTIGKDATTVAKEIRKHRAFKPRNTFNNGIMCANRKSCPTKPCLKKCEKHAEPKCSRRDKSPGACNKCPDSSKCRLDKYYYDAVEADKEYRRDLVDYREGLNLTTKERDTIGRVLAPLLKNGQSVHQILSAHPEISQCEKTSKSMASRIDYLQQQLGNQLFSALIPVLLTDRGTEFEMHSLFELDNDGHSRLSIFYCDPMQSSQKPHVENNHNYVREIIPNGYPNETA
jgi:IS30 family transposase